MQPMIRTFTGKEVNLLNFQIGDICIEDIAHALACVNRFNGHLKRPVSVAQHSVYVSRIVEQFLTHSTEGDTFDVGVCLQALLHDAAEAYVGDVTKWLKQSKSMKAFRELEDLIQFAIFEKFGCCWTLDPEVELADRIMVRFEGNKGFGDFKIDHPDYPPLTQSEIVSIGAWSPWSWKQAEEAFLLRFKSLTNGEI